MHLSPLPDSQKQKISICGCQHEAFRLIPKLRKEVIKILDQLPNKEPIDFGKVGWELLFCDPKHQHPEGIQGAVNTTKKCTYGCPKLCNHGAPGWNEKGYKARRDEGDALVEIQNQIEPEKFHNIQNMLRTRHILIDYRDALIEDFVKKFFQSHTIQKRQNRYTTIQKKHGYHTDEVFPCSEEMNNIHALLQQKDFFDDSRGNIQKIAEWLQRITHTIQDIQSEIEANMQTGTK